MKHIFILLAILVLSSCKKDDNNLLVPVTHELTVTYGSEFSNLPVQGATVKFVGTHQEYNVTTDANGKVQLTLFPDVYNIIAGISLTPAEAKTITHEEKATAFNGFIERLSINNQTALNSTLALTQNNANNTLIIKQIYLGSPRNAANGLDQFIEIYNATDTPINLNGYAIARNARNTTNKAFNWAQVTDKSNPNENYMYSQEIISFPSGYTIAPRKSILIARDATNHKEAAQAEWKNRVPDLSKADFEAINPPSYSGTVNDTDYPAPNMVSLWNGASGNAGMLNLYPSGDGLALIAATATDITSWEKVARPNSNGNGGTGNKIFVQIPAERILDGVNIQTYQAGKTLLMQLPQAVDAGFVRPTGNQNGSSFIRKYSNGIYKDTNNSTQDFEVIMIGDR